ncbi:MAG: hypothetical protein ACOC3T_02660, partial [Bacteroidota bacterium]
MKKTIAYRLSLALIIFFFWQYGKAQNIESFEYFFDTDPGYGNGQSLAVSPNNIVSLSSNLDLTNVSKGIHTLYFRSKQSGRWSQTMSKTIAVLGNSQLNNAEYFWDDDPGYGNGNPIPISSGGIVNLSFNPDISGLSDGV